MNVAKDAIIRDAFGNFESKREVIDLASEGAMEREGGEEEGEDDIYAQHVWLQTTFQTDESDDEDDEDVRKALDHCFRFMDGYRKGLTRPVPDYLIKQETMMRFKRSK